VLSTTAKAKKVEKAKEADKKQQPKPDVAMGEASGSGSADAAAAKGKKGSAASSSAEGAKPADKDKDKEPSTQQLHNPARVLPQQESMLAVVPGSRYDPIVKGPVPHAGAPAKLLRLCGFVMLEDRTPDEPQELLEPAQTGGAVVPSDMEEPKPPAPFEFTE
jgi:26S proteasome regulatory subunit N2